MIHAVRECPVGRRIWGSILPGQNNDLFSNLNLCEWLSRNITNKAMMNIGVE